MKVLVTGGAGYIGSVTTRQLVELGYEVVVLDNLYSGHPWAIPKKAKFLKGDIRNSEYLSQIIRQESVKAVVHFAGYIEVAESVANPLKYYDNNVTGSLNLIEACRKHGVEHLIFSSSAAVYGEPESIPINEDAPTHPLNPYGRTKLITEWALADVSKSKENSFNSVCLRYFNVAGATMDGHLGQATPRATHLVKLASQAACGVRDSVNVFGNDYPTKDGTCIRDYVHVEDLATAHVLALKYLMDGSESATFNCGYGHGFSVREVLEAMQRVSGKFFPIHEGARRPGDPACLVADNRRICQQLGWAPQFDNLDLICQTAYQWESSLLQAA